MDGTGIWLAGYLGGRHGSEVRMGRNKGYYICQPLFTSEWHTPGLWVSRLYGHRYMVGMCTGKDRGYRYAGRCGYAYT